VSKRERMCLCVRGEVIGWTYGLWFKWWLNFLVLQLLPIHVTEEAVFPDVSLTLRATAQTLAWVFGHQLKQHRAER